MRGAPSTAADPSEHPIPVATVAGYSGGVGDRLTDFLAAVADACRLHGLSATVEDDPPSVYVVSGGYSTHLVVREEVEDVPVLPEVGDAAPLYDWQRVSPATERAPTGRLEAELPEARGFPGRRRRWRDTSRWTLEEKVPQIVGELAARAAIVAEREDEAERRRAARQAEWEAAMAEAVGRHRQDVLLASLRAEVAAWSESNAAIAYADALDARAAREPDPAWAAAIRAWASWCRAEAARLDPLPAGPTTPPDAEPDPEDLRPYLGGWSPYGPDQ